MQAYYQDTDAGITLYHGDARDILPRLADRSVELLLTDPPYGVSWQSPRRQLRFDVMPGDEDESLGREVVKLALGKLRNHRHLYVFGPWDPGDLPVANRVELIWDKTLFGIGNLSLPWGTSHERITFGVYTLSKQEQAGSAGRLSARLRRGSILRCRRPNAMGVIHPSEKPVEILRQMIEASTVLGETVLDPFAGVGSTLVAARIEGRRCIGVEIEERWCEIAAQRLCQTVLPLEV